MTVVLDTNTLVQMFGQTSPHAPLKRALLAGRLVLAVSTPILLEYEEVLCRCSGRERWEDVARMFALIHLLHGTIREVTPSYRFRAITRDADDVPMRIARSSPTRISSSRRTSTLPPCKAAATGRRP